MEHPEAAVVNVDPVDDGLAALLDGSARDELPPRTGRQVLLLVVGWLIVLAIACVVLVLAAPAIQALVVTLVRAVAHAGQA
jgi:hypothetical protein